MKLAVCCLEFYTINIRRKRGGFAMCATRRKKTAWHSYYELHNLLAAKTLLGPRSFIQTQPVFISTNKGLQFGRWTAGTWEWYWSKIIWSIHHLFQVPAADLRGVALHHPYTNFPTSRDFPGKRLRPASRTSFRSSTKDLVNSFHPKATKPPAFRAKNGPKPLFRVFVGGLHSSKLT